MLQPHHLHNDATNLNMIITWKFVFIDNDFYFLSSIFGFLSHLLTLARLLLVNRQTDNKHLGGQICYITNYLINFPIVKYMQEL